MASIQPFRAFRPRPGMESKIASPPYDVLNSDEARIMAEGNPDSFLHVVKPEIDLPREINPYDDRVYDKGRENLDGLIQSGRMIRDKTPCLYLYRQIMGSHRQTGLVAGASIREYELDLIKKHEHTRKDKEDDRTRHVDTLNANAGPVFLTYQSSEEINRKIDHLMKAEPAYDFTAPDGIQHTVWVVPGESDIREIVYLFDAIPALYIADGHHRSASAVRVGQMRRAADPKPDGRKAYDYFLAVLFPHNQLKILDYNRVVKDLNGLSEDRFLAHAAENFDIEPVKDGKPAAYNTFGLYLPGRWFKLTVKPGTYNNLDPIERLDVSILQAKLLDPVLGIRDQRTDKRIDFVGGIRGMKELEKRVNAGEAAAFALYPTSIEQLMAIADAGMIMPPKSTWFEPKLRSGLLVRSLLDV